MEKTGKANLADQLAQLTASLASAESDRDKYKGIAEGAGAGAAAAQGKVSELSGQLEGEKKISSKALAQVEILNQQIAAMRRQLAALEDALNASEQRDKESQTRIADLGSRLNLALARTVQELSRYRSDFFGRLREILGQRPGVRVVGDRFVFESEVLFETGRADINAAGKAEMDQVAGAIEDLEREIPPEIPWVIRVDGHTDKRPVTGQFKSNWELSSARAIAVVQYLVSKGVSPQHLVAAGFGEYQPIDIGDSEDALRRNRRIELKLTER